MARTFASAIQNQKARTDNGMRAHKTAGNPCVELFGKIGGARGQDIIPFFVAAYTHNRDQAVRIAQWARDVRGGAGERKIYRDILAWLEVNDKDAAIALVKKTPLVGRFDDLLIFTDKDVRDAAFALIKAEIQAGNGLAAKWMPRKGPVATQLRNYLEMTPKRYRKTLVGLTKVVEQQMCAKQWDEINFSHVPSVAAARYRKAFYKHTPRYAQYVEALTKGEKFEEQEVKVNAAAVYPYDVLKNRLVSYQRLNATELKFLEAQWAALPNYMGDANILPLVDVSGSMTSPQLGKSGLTPLAVAVSLGLYCADKNTGKFKDCFLTFSSNPELLNLKGNINQKIDQMVSSQWQMSTNLHAAFDKILSVAVQNQVPAEEMPQMLLIFSDMQFNCCHNYDDTAIQMIRRKYEAAGYEVPKVVFWHLNAVKNTAVKFDENGTALVSGFSPAIVKSLLNGSLAGFTPENVMLETIMKERYDW